MVCDRLYHRYRCAVGPHHATSAAAAGWHHPTHRTFIPSPTVPHPRPAHRVAHPYPIALPVSIWNTIYAHLPDSNTSLRDCIANVLTRWFGHPSCLTPPPCPSEMIRRAWQQYLVESWPLGPRLYAALLRIAGPEDRTWMWQELCTWSAQAAHRNTLPLIVAQFLCPDTLPDSESFVVNALRAPHLEVRSRALDAVLAWWTSCEPTIRNRVATLVSGAIAHESDIVLRLRMAAACAQHGADRPLPPSLVRNDIRHVCDEFCTGRQGMEAMELAIALMTTDPTRWGEEPFLSALATFIRHTPGSRVRDHAVMVFHSSLAMGSSYDTIRRWFRSITTPPPPCTPVMHAVAREYIQQHVSCSSSSLDPCVRSVILSDPTIGTMVLERIEADLVHRLSAHPSTEPPTGLDAMLPTLWKIGDPHRVLQIVDHMLPRISDPHRRIRILQSGLLSSVAPEIVMRLRRYGGSQLSHHIGHGLHTIVQGESRPRILPPVLLPFMRDVATQPPHALSAPILCSLWATDPREALTVTQILLESSEDTHAQTQAVHGMSLAWGYGADHTIAHLLSGLLSRFPLTTNLVTCIMRGVIHADEPIRPMLMAQLCASANRLRAAQRQAVADGLLFAWGKGCDSLVIQMIRLLVARPDGNVSQTLLQVLDRGWDYGSPDRDCRPHRYPAPNGDDQSRTNVQGSTIVYQHHSQGTPGHQ
jgi:hypothetical protein